MIDWANAAWAGVVGAAVMLVMIALGRMVGLIQADMAPCQGCILTGRADGSGPFLAGAAMHLAVGLVHWLVAGFGILVTDA